MLDKEIKRKTILIDSAVSGFEAAEAEFNQSLVMLTKKHKSTSWLFSNSGRTDKFYTNDSKLYLTQEDLVKIRRGERILSFGKKFDCILPREVRKELRKLPRRKLGVAREVRERYTIMEDYWSRLFDNSVRGFGLSRAWNFSIVFSVILGMFLMTMLYRYLGPGASAVTKTSDISAKQVTEAVLGDEDTKKNEEITQKLLADYQELLKKGNEKEAIADKIREMTKGYPIEKMAGEIASKDKVIAAFLVGIAMKESTWGKHVPVLDGKDCYNYWGYRGKRARMGTGGHTCFDSRKDAVDTVSKRLEFLVNNEKIATPEKMVTVWKCGYDCSWDSKQAVQKWISDVDKYFDKFNEATED
jgi:hypothetical protein